MEPREVLRERLLANRQIDANGCWLWTKAVSGHMGYGQTSIPGLRRSRSVLVHRVAAFVWLGFDIDSPGCVLHRCDVPRCFNPAHLFFGTVADNQRDMKNKGRGRNNPRRGEAHRLHVLTDVIVADMRNRADAVGHARGVYSALAREYGVTPQRVRQICLRRAWRHVA